MMCILEYLRRARNYMLVCHCDEIVHIEYANLDFHSDKDSYKSTSIFIFTLGGVCIVDFTMESDYATTFKTTKKIIWFREFLTKLGVVPLVVPPIILLYDNSKVVTQLKEPRNY